MGERRCQQKSTRMTDKIPGANGELPCPFCGHLGRYWEYQHDYGWERRVDCDNCTVTGPDCATKEEAIAAWNKRTDTQDIPTRRKRASYLSVTEAFNLNAACRVLRQAELNVYLVGSCLHHANYRDVDIRAILTDDEFYKMFGGNHRKLLLLNTALSEWLSARTSLPIDFQFQEQTKANKDFPGIRDAVGLETVQ